MNGTDKLGGGAPRGQGRGSPAGPAWLDGRLLGDAGPAVRALRYGDGLFATLRLSGGRLLDAELHAERLLAGARLLDLDPPPGWTDPARIVARLLEAALALDAGPETVLRCQWSAASESRGYARGREATALVERFPVPGPRELRVAVLDDDEVPAPTLPTVKSCSALPHVLAARAAARRSVAEAVRVVGGRVTEAVSANLFWLEEGRLRTPDSGLPLYPGVTRERTIEAAAALGLPVEEGRWTPADLRRAEAVALTSSVRGVERIAMLDGVALAAVPELRALAAEVDRVRLEGAPRVEGLRGVSDAADGRTDG